MSMQLSRKAILVDKKYVADCKRILRKIAQLRRMSFLDQSKLNHMQRNARNNLDVPQKIAYKK